ncbi:MAG: PhzF family phenazine biosynthesis protein [Bacteroidales bacterium]
MRLPIYQVDAFTDNLFGGNPAAVVPLTDWLPSGLMQQIARENNLSETAFFIPDGTDFHIRWFTPGTEVALCGHATLATAHVLFYHLKYEGESVHFHSQSGILRVYRSKNKLVLDFPADAVCGIESDTGLSSALGVSPVKSFRGRDDVLLVFENEEQIKVMQPDFGLLARCDARGVIVTAPGKTADFVSRFFGPRVGINEDPVTGSAHTLLTPYWAKQIGKTELSAVQLSERGGILQCSLRGDRVHIAGNAVSYLVGEIDVPEE